MKAGPLAAILGVITALCGCSKTSTVDPMADGARSSVSSISIEVSGSRFADASTVGARGSREGVRRSTGQTPPVGSSLTMGGLVVDLLIKGVAAAKGAIDAQPESVVDEARSNLQNALQETDFGGLLRAPGGLQGQRSRGNRGGRG
jgi:hypothetical protein